MAEELKVRIFDYGKTEAYLLRQGAKFYRQLHVTDTYFNQPPGEVLKVTEDDSGDYLVELKSSNSKFEIVKYASIYDAKAIKKELSDKFGIKCVLKKKRRFFDYLGYKLNINLIEGVGEFLIIEGDNLDPQSVLPELDLDTSEVIKVSFDNLARNKFT